MRSGKIRQQHINKGNKKKKNISTNGGETGTEALKEEGSTEAVQANRTLPPDP